MSVDNLRFVSSRSLSENDTNLLLKGVTMVIFFSRRSKRLQNVKNNYYPLDFNDFQKVKIFFRLTIVFDTYCFKFTCRTILAAVFSIYYI